MNPCQVRPARAAHAAKPVKQKVKIRASGAGSNSKSTADDFAESATSCLFVSAHPAHAESAKSYAHGAPTTSPVAQTLPARRPQINPCGTPHHAATSSPKPFLASPSCLAALSHLNSRRRERPLRPVPPNHAAPRRWRTALARGQRLGSPARAAQSASTPIAPRRPPRGAPKMPGPPASARGVAGSRQTVACDRSALLAAARSARSSQSPFSSCGEVPHD